MRKMFFGGQGELRDRTYNDQLNAASSLNLLVAAIVPWNTVQMQVALRQIREDGHRIKESDLVHLSPLMRHHIGLYGQYHFNVDLYGKSPLPNVDY